MSGVRIEFAGVLPSVYAERLEEWRETVARVSLPKIAVRVATVLPKYLNREQGYCFPGDEEIASRLDTSTRSVGRGMTALEGAGLIERETVIRQDANREAAGKIRRVFLCLPSERTETGPSERTESERTSERTDPSERTVSSSERTEKGRVNGRTSVRITSEGTSDNRTSDNSEGTDDRQEGVYARETSPSGGSLHSLALGCGGLKSEHPPRPPAVEQPATVRSDRTVEPMHPVHELPKGVADRAPLPRNPYPTPKAFDGDFAFLDAFDRFVIEIAGDDVPAGEINRITAEAFDRATDSDDSFMPFHWESVVALRDDGATANWFRWRAGSLIHRKAAA